MSHVECPHCSQPIENDPTLAGVAAVCPHCDGEFQFPEAVPAAEKRVPAAASSSRRAPPGKTKAPSAPSSDAKKKAGQGVKSEEKKSKSVQAKSSTAGSLRKSDGKKKSGDNATADVKEKLAGLNWKKLGPQIGIGVLVVGIGLYFAVGRQRDYSAEQEAVRAYIKSNMPKAKLDSFGAKGLAKGCTTTNGVKIPQDGIVIQAHVWVGGITKFKKDLVFIVVNGRVKNEIERGNFRTADKK